MKDRTNLVSFITALILHLLVGAVLLMGIDFSLPKENKKEEVIISASVVSQKQFDDLASKKEQIEADKVAAKKREAEKIRKEKERVAREKRLAEKKRQEAEIKRKQVEQAAIERKKQEEEKRLFDKIVAEKALKAKQEAEAKRIQEDIARKKQEAERIVQQKAEAKKVEAEKQAAAEALKVKQEKEEKLKAEKVAKELAEKEAQRIAAEKAEQLRQEELDRQMQAEFDDAFSSAQTSKQLSEIARYKALIQNKISRHWQVEPSMKGESCTLAIRLAPDGLVLSVSRSRGDERLCMSAKRATLSAKTLPIPKDPEIAQQFRDFDITLEPDL